MSKIVSIAEKQIIDSVTSALKANMADGTFMRGKYGKGNLESACSS